MLYCMHAGIGTLEVELYSSASHFHRRAQPNPGAAAGWTHSGKTLNYPSGHQAHLPPQQLDVPFSSKTFWTIKAQTEPPQRNSSVKNLSFLQLCPSTACNAWVLAEAKRSPCSSDLLAAQNSTSCIHTTHNAVNLKPATSYAWYICRCYNVTVASIINRALS